MRSSDTAWCYDRWQRLPDDGNRYEVIDGVLYMSTAPGQFHQWIVVQLIALIGLPLRAQGVAYVYTAPIGVIMPGADPVQPDFLLVRQDRVGFVSDTRITAAPDLIAEVLSPSNVEHDTETKRRAYARAGVPEYWIVRPATRDVLVCWQPDESLGDYAQRRLVPPDGMLEAATLPVRVTVAELFAGAPDTEL
ncbi:MAG TPA: Uma2 family endonuclease [Thermomicrobiales bacterium]|nr:Uma2 family endonuclease [Thermomicrobiales bacterium]